MGKVISLLNKYIAHNGLMDRVYTMGGNMSYYKVIIDFGESKSDRLPIFGLIDSINRHTGKSGTLSIEKKTNKATITYKKGKW